VGGSIAQLIIFARFVVLEKYCLENAYGVQMVAFYGRLLHGYQLSDSSAFILENAIDQKQAVLQHICIFLSFLDDLKKNAQNLLKIITFVEELSLIIVRVVQEALEPHQTVIFQ